MALRLGVSQKSLPPSKSPSELRGNRGDYCVAGFALLYLTYYVSSPFSCHAFLIPDATCKRPWVFLSQEQLQYPCPYQQRSSARMQSSKQQALWIYSVWMLILSILTVNREVYKDQSNLVLTITLLVLYSCNARENRFTYRSLLNA